MDYYQGVVSDYLRADRAIFINAECCIQLSPGPNPDVGIPHWFCDAVACDLRNKTAFLCEISFSKSLSSLINRLAAWNDNWAGVRLALQRECAVPADWQVRPWAFVPEHLVPVLLRGLQRTSTKTPLAFAPRITTLEMVQPWLYRSWDRQGEAPKPACIPLEMQG